MRRWVPGLGLALVFSCASTEERPDLRVRPLSELPVEHRELWQAWRSRAPDWELRREHALDDPSLRRFLLENLAAEMVGSYVSGELSAAHEARLGRFERARAELLTIGAPAVPTVAEFVAIADGAAAHPCMELLVRIGAPATETVSAMLRRSEPDARERAALVLARIPPLRGEEEERVRSALAAALVADPAWNVRVACARALGGRGGRYDDPAPARGALTPALADPDPAVRRAALQALGTVGDLAALPAVINALERADRDADVGTVLAALATLRHLTGEGDDGPRRPEEWRAWWREGGRRP